MMVRAIPSARITHLAGALILGLAAKAAWAQETPVNYGVAIFGSSDAGIFIADKKGYFKAEGIKLNIVPFDSAAKMIAPLGAGHLDVAGGAISAGLFNATARGVNIKIVADKGSTPPGHGYSPFMVRADLIASGKVKTAKDLKGLKVAMVAPGISPTGILNEVLKSGGLGYKDVEVTYMAYPQHVIAFQNKAIDASVTTEPNATVIENEKSAVRFIKDDEIYPYHQIAVIIYGEHFIKKDGEVARKFMRAYIKGVRDYNHGLKDGKLSSGNAEETIAILSEYTPIKDAKVHRSVVSHSYDPDGRVNVDSLKKDFAFFKEMGWIEGETSVDRVVDNSFVDWAIQSLGKAPRK
ncbi:MAG: ABC transporter substrate-binding protein [Rhodospirillales bacterium]|nr:ABC transporter substrate-binding protein [Rhodospirillales bacterium]